MNTPQISTIIATTGTKGKTSVTRAIHHVVDAIESVDVLRVDTNSVFVGSRRVFGLDASRNNAGYVPSVAPGRFLALIHDQPKQVAVLEASIGCYRAGLAYQRHTVGIFTNVFEDHIGTADYLKDQTDLANAKAAFIFGSIKKGGAAVYNHDDRLVRERAEAIDPERHVELIACTLRENDADQADHIVTVKNGWLIVRSEGVEHTLLNIATTPWLLGGAHEPTLYNALFVLGALLFLYGSDGETFTKALAILKDYEPAADGGRMVIRETADGAKLILDYAHEKQSMKYIAEYAHTIAGESGRVIGVLRLDSSRPSEHTRETGRFIAPFYDTILVYDKDISRGNDTTYSEATTAFYEGLKDGGADTTLVHTDMEALEAAKRIAKPEDVIIYIISSYAHSYQKAYELLHLKQPLTPKETV